MSSRCKQVADPRFRDGPYLWEGLVADHVALTPFTSSARFFFLRYSRVHTSCRRLWIHGPLEWTLGVLEEP